MVRSSHWLSYRYASHHASAAHSLGGGGLICLGATPFGAANFGGATIFGAATPLGPEIFGGAIPRGMVMAGALMPGCCCDNKIPGPPGAAMPGATAGFVADFKPGCCCNKEMPGCCWESEIPTFVCCGEDEACVFPGPIALPLPVMAFVPLRSDVALPPGLPGALTAGLKPFVPEVSDSFSCVSSPPDVLMPFTFSSTAEAAYQDVVHSSTALAIHVA